MNGKQVRAAILLFLDERRRANPSETVDDTVITEALGLPLADVRDGLAILADQGYTKQANTFEVHSAYISPAGMAVAEEIREATENPDGGQPPPIGFS